MISSRSSGTPSASISRSERAISDSGMPEQAHDPLLVGPGALEQRAAAASVSSAVSHIGCSSRGGPGQHEHGRRVPGTTSPGAVPTGSSTVAPSGTSACLRLLGAHRVLVEVAPAAAQPLEDRPDALLERRVERQRAPGEVRDDLGGQVVGGRAEAAAGDDEVEALGRP